MSRYRVLSGVFVLDRRYTHGQEFEHASTTMLRRAVKDGDILVVETSELRLKELDNGDLG